MAEELGSDAATLELPKEFYWKTYSDPLTGRDFSTLAVKRSAYTLRGRDVDFAPRYEGVNPLWYAVIVAPSGFAAEDATYRRSRKLLFRDREALLAQIEGQPPLPDFSGERDLPLACRASELALGYTKHLRIPRHEVAGLALRASWVYRDWAEEGHEAAVSHVHALRRIALEHYLEAYEQEDTSQLKLGSAGVGYLIAELLRELGRYDESLRWFSRVVTDKKVRGEVKRHARDQMDLCREQRAEAKASGKYTKPQPERRTERTMYQLYRDQVNWLTNQAAAGELGESEIMRAVVDGVKEAQIELAQFTTEEALAAWLARRLTADED